MSTSVSRRSSATAHPTRQQLDELDALLKRMLDLPVNRGDDEAEAGPPVTDGPPQVAASAPEPFRGPHRAAPAPETTAQDVNYSTADEDDADMKPRVVSGGAEADPNPPAAEQGRADEWVPLTAAWRPSARTWKPLTEAWKQAQAAAAPATPAVPEEPSLAPAPDPEPAPANRELPAEPAAPSVPEAAASAPEMPDTAPASEAPPAWKKLPRLTVKRWSFVWPLALFNTAFDVCLSPWGAPGRWMRGRAGRTALGVVGLLCLALAAGLTVADWFGWTR